MKRLKNAFKNSFKNNNRGLTLVELIVAVSMFAIVGAMIVGLITISTRTYTNTSSEIYVQEEAQLVVNQIKDLMIDANRAVVIGLEALDASNPKAFTAIDEVNSEDVLRAAWSAEGVDVSTIRKVLVIYNEKSLVTNVGGVVTTTYTYPVSKIIFDEENEQLYYAKAEFADLASISVSSFGTTDADSFLLSDYVTSFDVDLSDVENSNISLQIDFSTETDTGAERNFSSTPSVNLRNKVIVSENVSDIYAGGTIEKDSFVVGVEIQKNGATITSDVLNRNSSANYTALVDAQFGASTGYTWELSGDVAGDLSSVSNDGLVTIPYDAPSSVLTLIATSVADKTKKASIPITLLSAIVPTNVGVTFTESEISGTSADVRKTITFTATTSYSDGSSTNGQDIVWTAPSNLPTGSYYYISTSGKLVLCLKEDAGSTDYTVQAQTTIPNSVGNYLSDSKTVSVPSLLYVDTSLLTISINSSLTTIARFDEIDLTAVVDGFDGNQANLNYTWECLYEDSTGFSTYGKDGFNNVSLYKGYFEADSTRHLYVGEKLNWQGSYEVKVRLTVSGLDANGVERSGSCITSYTILPVAINAWIENPIVKTNKGYFGGDLRYSFTNLNYDALVTSYSGNLDIEGYCTGYTSSFAISDAYLSYRNYSEDKSNRSISYQIYYTWNGYTLNSAYQVVWVGYDRDGIHNEITSGSVKAYPIN